MYDERKCKRCGSVRTQVVAQSVSPPGVFLQCSDCGFSSLVPLNGAPPPAPPGTPSASDVDKRRVERIVNTVIGEKRLPCQLLSVERNGNGWRIAVRTQVSDFVKFDVRSESLSLMKAAIEHALVADI